MKTGLNYHIIFTNTGKQKALQSVLSRALPEETGRVFIPMREYWVRKEQTVEQKPLFPGYIIFRTDMDRRSLHEFVKYNRRDIQTFVRELENRTLLDSGMDVTAVYPEDPELEITDVSAEEKELLDNVLDEDGVWRMSRGCKRDGKFIVPEGPLSVYTDRIKEVDRHNREAVLDLDFRGHRVVAGLELKPVRYFFPWDTDAPELLDDGTEVDLKDLAKKMMAHAVGLSSR